MSTANSTIVIAGGTSGIGLATAKRLAATGAKVIVTGRNPEKLQQAVASIGGNAAGQILDSSDRNSLQQAFEKIGKIDHLVIAVSGAKGAGLFKELDLQVLLAGFEEKLVPQMQTAQVALPFMHPKGSITFVSAVSARAKTPGVAGLGAINGAIEIMVPVMAKELKPLRINAVSPGVVDTDWWNFMSPEVKKASFEQYAAITPVERVGLPDDIAQVIELLVSNTFITGQVIAADGGLAL
ncbi:SDR family oxidoreductase [Deminuibacter soli]|uniref:SDR family NAD(P)-dependent oxidoreductase n=1 Tax=Deminuibacter soli TaxID=2291815 RepID=A0A3E1NHK1_9BACT|nr:SDR family oxidoreductase [Deminuibacter soli]RFM27433.1 SDR family NAD(P)-dependent oxidoreductase [Deminuibacter soli]